MSGEVNTNASSAEKDLTSGRLIFQSIGSHGGGRYQYQGSTSLLLIRVSGGFISILVNIGIVKTEQLLISHIGKGKTTFPFFPLDLQNIVILVKPKKTMIYLLRQGFSFKGLRSDLQKWNLNTNLNKLEEQKCVHDNSSEHKHDTKRTKYFYDDKDLLT